MVLVPRYTFTQPQPRYLPTHAWCVVLRPRYISLSLISGVALLRLSYIAIFSVFFLVH